MTYDLDWLVKNYGAFFANFGINEAALTAHFEDWKAQSNDLSVKNYLWYLFHVLIGETKKQVRVAVDLHRNLHDIYLQMLTFRLNVEGEKDNGLVQLIIQNRIRQWQVELPQPFYVQAIALSCCPHCESINGEIFEPEEALRHPHFATAACTNESGCSCGYIPVTAGHLQ